MEVAEDSLRQGRRRLRRITLSVAKSGAGSVKHIGEQAGTRARTFFLQSPTSQRSSKVFQIHFKFGHDAKRSFNFLTRGFRRQADQACALP